jgi:hypothetical protein
MNFIDTGGGFSVKSGTPDLDGVSFGVNDAT